MPSTASSSSTTSGSASASRRRDRSAPTSRPTGLYTADVRSYNVANGVEMANKLLDEAGYPREARTARASRSCTTSRPTARNGGVSASTCSSSSAKVGIKVTLRYEDVPTWLRRVYTNYDFDADQQLDPDAGRSGDRRAPPLSLEVDQGRARCSSTTRGWSSPETDELMDEATVEIDPKKRRGDLYHQFQKNVVEASPLVYVHGARLHHRLQQEAAGLAGEPARPVRVVRPGLAGQVADARSTGRATGDRRRDCATSRAGWRSAVPTILTIVVLNFALLHLAPGDAADVLAGEAGAATPRIHGAAAPEVRPRPAAVRAARRLSQARRHARPRLLVPPRHARVRAHREPARTDAAADADGPGDLGRPRRAARRNRGTQSQSLARQPASRCSPCSPTPRRCSGRGSC